MKKLLLSVFCGLLVFSTNAYSGNYNIQNIEISLIELETISDEPTLLEYNDYLMVNNDEKPKPGWFMFMKIDIIFGTNMPECSCCYGGICSISIGRNIGSNPNPKSDEVLLGVTTNGDVYLVVESIDRKEFSEQFELAEAVNITIESINSIQFAQKEANSNAVLFTGLNKGKILYPIKNDDGMKCIKLN